MNVQQPPPMPALQINLQDESHLNMLAIFHYVLGGLCLLGLGFIILHFLMMTFFFGMASTISPTYSTPAPIAVVEIPIEVEADVEIQMETEAIEIGETSTTTAPSGHVSAPVPFPGFPKEMIAIFAVFYVVFGVIISAMAAANFMSGRFIKKRKNKTFSIVVAAINCLQMPFGTVLGVFTIIVLMRPSVQSGYEVNERG
ncbi:MAG: hypothetical protein IZT59_08220 [Verrucomicrobia bacterium]|nr:hypothetical protein [Verrucomicrobiota bacterium]